MEKFANPDAAFYAIAGLQGITGIAAVYTVAGAALMGTFVTSVAGVIFYQGLAWLYPNVSVGPDWFLGILFGIGGMAGMYCGACCQKFVPEKNIKWMLAAIISFTAAKYIAEFFGI